MLIAMIKAELSADTKNAKKMLQTLIEITSKRETMTQRAIEMTVDIIEMISDLNDANIR